MWADYKMKVNWFWKLHWKSSLERHKSHMLWTFTLRVHIRWKRVILFFFPLLRVEVQRIQNPLEMLEYPFELIVLIRSGILAISSLVTFCNPIWLVRLSKGFHSRRADENTWMTSSIRVSSIFLIQFHLRCLLSFPSLYDHALIVVLHHTRMSSQIRLLSWSFA